MFKEAHLDQTAIKKRAGISARGLPVPGLFLDNQRSPRKLRATIMKGGRVESELLHTEKILADRKTFFLDLKQNSRGMVVKITEDVGGNRDTIMVPAEILGDFIAALNDIKETADNH